MVVGGQLDSKSLGKETLNCVKKGTLKNKESLQKRVRFRCSAGPSRTDDFTILKTAVAKVLLIDFSFSLVDFFL